MEKKMKLKIDKKSLLGYLTYLVIIASGIVFDQLTKLLAVKFLKGADDVKVIGNFLKLSYVENRGSAFGMLKDARWVFMSVSTLAIIAMIAYLFTAKNQSRLYTVSIAVIASGGIGNMIDRIALGYVVDFVSVKYFAVFNGADSLVCVGAGFLILAMLLDLIKEAKAQKEKKSRGEE